MSQTYSRRKVLGLFAGGALATGFTFASGRPTANRAAALTFIAGTPEATPPEAEKPILRLEYTGGFVPVEYTLTALPAFSLYADGRVITTAPMIDIYPRPALQNLRVMTLTEGGIGRVLAEARTAGLFDGPAGYPLDGIADASSTVFTLNVDGVSTVVWAYALGFEEPEFTKTEFPEERAKLSALVSFLFNLQFELAPEEIASPDEAFVSEAIRIYSRPIDTANPPWQDVIPDPDPMEWPLATPLSELGEPYPGPFGEGTRCDAFTGEDAATLLEELAGASQLTPWLSEETLYQLWVRPLLPDEFGCVPIVPDVN